MIEKLRTMVYGGAVLFCLAMILFFIFVLEQYTEFKEESNLCTTFCHNNNLNVVGLKSEESPEIIHYCICSDKGIFKYYSKEEYSR